MPSSPSPAPQPPCRTINDLPTELKKRIVELVAQQDEAYEEWTAALLPKLGGPMRNVMDEQKARNKSSLGALFRVSKEWSNLAAPLRFRVLRASRIDLNFQMYIALSRSCHFTSFVLDSEDPTCVAPAIAVLARARKVHKLVIHRRVFDVGSKSPVHLFKVHSPNTLYSHVCSTLYRLSKLVDVVQLDRFPNVDVQSIVRQWSALRVLHLNTSRLAILKEVQKFAGGISAASQLTRLHLAISPEEDEVEGVDVDLDTLCNALRSRTLPPLRSLSLSVPLLHPTTFTFAHLFSGSLEELDLRSMADASEDADYIEPRFDVESFPLLRTLRLEGYYVYNTVDSMEGRHFPALCHLEVVVRVYDELSPGDLPLASLAANLPSLRSLRWHSQQRLGPSAANELKEVGSSRNIATFDAPAWPACPEAPFSVPDLNGRYKVADNIPPSVAFVRRLRDYLSDELERTSKVGDEAALLPLAEALRPLELERLARTG